MLPGLSASISLLVVSTVNPFFSASAEENVPTAPPQIRSRSDFACWVLMSVELPRSDECAEKDAGVAPSVVSVVMTPERLPLSLAASASVRGTENQQSGSYQYDAMYRLVVRTPVDSAVPPAALSVTLLLDERVSE